MDTVKTISTDLQPTRTPATIPLEVLERAADTLKAIAHPVRLRIVDLLGCSGELCVGDLVTALDAKSAITSQQLAILRDRGVVVCRRDGNRIYYKLANPNLLRMLDCVRDHCSRGCR
jgi:DNA-binding transcriptional ArsR family regulator